MSISRKKKPTLSVYNRQILGFVDEFRETTGESGEDLGEVAKWVTDSHSDWWEPPRRLRPEQILARDLAKACARDYISDEDGEPVRRRHSYRDQERQQTFWFKIEEATPQQMRISAQERRRGALSDVLQIDRDLGYYNRNHNPGDPIQMSFDFDQDVAERRQPTDYPDAPPEDD